MSAVASLRVQVRTAGAASLVRLAATFRRLSASANGFSARVGPQLRETMLNLSRSALTMLTSLGALAAKMLMLGSMSIPLIHNAGLLAGALGMIPAVALTAAAAMTTLKMAFHGVGDALSAGLEGDTEAYTKALKNLAPAAQEMVRTVVAAAPAWRNVRKQVQQALFEDLVGTFWKLNAVIQPLAATYLPQIARLFNRAAKDVAAFFSTEQAANSLDIIMRGITGTMENLLRMARPLSQIFLDLAEAAIPSVNRLTRGMAGLVEKAAAWIRAVKESGQLESFFARVQMTIEQLGRIVRNVGAALAAIFRGGQESGEGMLDTIERLTARLAAWLNSKDGQTWVQTMGVVASFMMQLAEIAGHVAATGREMESALRVAFAGILQAALGALSGILQAAVVAFGWMPVLGPRLRAAAAEFSEFAARVNAELASIKDQHVNVFVEVRQRGAVPGRANFSNGGSAAVFGTRAAGGPVLPGRTYLVGEQGPELVTFGAAGRVHSNSDSARMVGGGGGRPIQVSMNGGRMSGLDSMFAAWFEKAVRDGLITITG